jgi:hypothetical protein
VTGGSSKAPAWLTGIVVAAILTGAPQASAGEVIPLPTGGEGCSHAIVRTGHGATTIAFSIRCSARRERRVGFAISRRPGRPTGIIAFAPVRVTGVGAASPRARCGLNRGVLGCHTSITGPVRISGSFRVRAGTRCDGNVSLVQIT